MINEPWNIRLTNRLKCKLNFHSPDITVEAFLYEEPIKCIYCETEIFPLPYGRWIKTPKKDF